MTWFSRLFSGSEGTAQTLTAGQQQALATWQQLPAADWQRSHYRCRYVVVDVEATGSNVTSDRLRALAALSLVDGQIAFADAFQLALADADQPADMPAAFPPLVGPSIDALIAFLQFVGKAPLVGYNVPFVARMIDQVLGERLGLRLEQPWIDLAWVLPDVFREAHEPQWRLDAWLLHFGVDSIERHNALSDAFATAQLLQITMAHAARKGFETAASLRELEKARRHLYQSG
jgi:DNA polymerase-3 subunit epsilon